MGLANGLGKTCCVLVQYCVLEGCVVKHAVSWCRVN